MTTFPDKLSHEEVEAEGLIDLYCRESLGEELERRFEEHLLTCGRCQEALETARSLRRGLKTLAAQEAQRVAVSGAIASNVMSRRRRLGLGLGAVLLVGALLPTIWLLREKDGLEIAVARGQNSLDQAKADHRTLARELAAARSSSAIQLERLEEELAAAQRSAVTTPARPKEPRADLPVLLLSVMRDGTVADPVEISSGQALTLAVDVGDEGDIASYRLRLLDENGSTRWKKNDLQPTVLEAILFTVPDDWLAAGTYTLVVDALKVDGEYAEHGRFVILAKDP